MLEQKAPFGYVGLQSSVCVFRFVPLQVRVLSLPSVGSANGVSRSQPWTLCCDLRCFERMKVSCMWVFIFECLSARAGYFFVFTCLDLFSGASSRHANPVMEKIQELSELFRKFMGTVSLFFNHPRVFLCVSLSVSMTMAVCIQSNDSERRQYFGKFMCAGDHALSEEERIRMMNKMLLEIKLVS